MVSLNLDENPSINSLFKIFANMPIKARSRIHRWGWAQEFLHRCMGLLSELLPLHYLPDTFWFQRAPLFRPLFRNCPSQVVLLCWKDGEKGKWSSLEFSLHSWSCSSTQLKRRFVSFRMLSPTVFLYFHALHCLGLSGNWGKRGQKERKQLRNLSYYLWALGDLFSPPCPQITGILIDLNLFAS